MPWPRGKKRKASNDENDSEIVLNVNIPKKIKQEEVLKTEPAEKPAEEKENKPSYRRFGLHSFTHQPKWLKGGQ